MSIARADEPRSGGKAGGHRRHLKTTSENNNPPAKTKKLTVTVASEVLEGEDSYLAFLDELDQELGPPGEEDYAWARRVIGQ
jgi:hypothetical protein